MAKNELVTKNNKIAVALFISFFLFLFKYSTFIVKSSSNQLSILLIIKVEIYDTIFEISLLKKIRYNKIPILVWKKNWSNLKDFIMSLF